MNKVKLTSFDPFDYKVNIQLKYIKKNINKNKYDLILKLVNHDLFKVFKFHKHLKYFDLTNINDLWKLAK